VALLGFLELDGEGGKKPATLVEIHALHFNFWMIPQGWIKSAVSIFKCEFKTTHFHIDIGIRLTVKSGAIDSIKMILPCIDAKTAYTDLSEIVLDEKINDLIFGRPVKSNTNTISYVRNGQDIVDNVIKTTVKTNDDKQNIAEIRFTSPVNATKNEVSIYIRFRYTCNNVDTLFISKGWGLAKKGYVFDLRINDVRETIERHLDPTRKLLDVKEVNAFLIHPINYMRQTEGTQSFYSRLLEFSAWSEYLKGVYKEKIYTKMVISQWKNNTQISSSSPYRIFAHINKEFGQGLLLFYLIGALTGPFINLVIWLFGLLTKGLTLY
jgi:hypothetical protein